MAKMTRSEAGRLGAIKTNELRKHQKEEQLLKEMEEYEQNPKYCLECGEKIPFEKRFGKFCSKSCSTTYTNKQRQYNKKPLNVCFNCGKETPNEKYCSNECQKEHEYVQYISSWKEHKIDGSSAPYGVSRYIRRYLLEKYNNSCQCCGWNKENPFTHNIPLEIHHIDGNYKNNSEDNLQLLCPNCHSLTETYKAANKNGRKERKKYN